MDTSSASSYLQKRDETIAAPATPPGRGALNLIRISGPLAVRGVERLTGKSFEDRRLTLVSIKDAGQAMAVVFRAPRSYTGQDMAEITLFGNPLLTMRLMRRLAGEGIRAAGPGEFTWRAFMAGKMDLTQAEAVHQIIEAVNPIQLKGAMEGLAGAFGARIAQLRARTREVLTLVEAALEFPEDAVEAGDGVVRAALDGLGEETERLRNAVARAAGIGAVTLVIAGPANAGKSTLFNALLGYDRALVHEQPGTTRDVLRETLLVREFPVALSDTAGLYDNIDAITSLSMEKTQEALSDAFRILFVVDGSLPAEGQIWPSMAPLLGGKALLVANKCDLGLHPSWERPGLLAVSARGGAHLDRLWTAMEGWMDELLLRGTETPFWVSLRQEQVLDAFVDSVRRARTEAEAGGSLEIGAQHLWDGMRALQDLTGELTPEEVLDGIFSRFCIGK